MFDNVRADVDRYVYMSGKSWLSCLLWTQGLWAIAEYRYSHWAHTKVRMPIVRQLLNVVGQVWHKFVQVTTGIDLAKGAEIGKGFYIGHFGGIFLGNSVRIGENCNISQGVTIGIAGRGESRGSPSVGSRVYIGPGAKIFGPIIIGDDVAIGANAVVTRDIPDKAVAVGVPAKVISYDGSADFIAFRV